MTIPRNDTGSRSADKTVNFAVGFPYTSKTKDVRKVTEAEFDLLYAKHSLWLQGEQVGERMVLEDVELVRDHPGTPINLRNHDLRKAILKNVDFDWACLEDADLEGADLTGATHFHPHALAGANLKNAKLPSEITWSEVARVEEISKNCGKYFIAVLAAGAYVLLTLFGTSDVNLIGDSASSSLPFLQIPVSIVQFYWVVPALLIAAGLFFCLNMQTLWDNMKWLPAIMPTGANVDEATYPWIVNSEARFFAKRLRSSLTTLDHNIEIVVSCLTLWFIPVVLWSIWARCLPRHDIWLSGYQAACTMITIWLAYTLQRLKSATLRRDAEAALEIKMSRSSKRGIKRALASYSTCTILALFWIFVTSEALIVPPHSYFWFNFIPLHIKERLTARGLFDRLHLKYTADIERAQVSTRPSGFKGLDEEECREVQGGSFKGRDVQNANAKYAFLVNANLQESNLSYTDLEYADLRAARLEKYDGEQLLEQTDDDALRFIYKHANLAQKAIWDHTNLQHVDMRWSRCAGDDFIGSNFSYADLTGANFTGANMNAAKLNRAIIADTHFDYCNGAGVNFSNAVLDDTHLATSARLSANLPSITYSNKIFFVGFRFAYLVYSTFNNCKLPFTDFFEADLKDADIEAADLRGANLEDADLELTNLSQTDLEGADFEGADLWRADLYQTHLKMAHFEMAHLEGAVFVGADLRGARFSRADLRGAFFSGVDLRGADFSGADLRGADLSGVDLTGGCLANADLTGARLKWAKLTGVDFGGAKLTGTKILDRIL